MPLHGCHVWYCVRRLAAICYSNPTYHAACEDAAVSGSFIAFFSGNWNKQNKHKPDPYPGILSNPITKASQIYRIRKFF